MVLGGGAFEKYLNHEGGALTNGVGALRNLRELPHHFNLVITQLEGANHEAGRVFPWPWTLQNSRTVKNKFLLLISYSVCDVFYSLQRLRQ